MSLSMQNQNFQSPLFRRSIPLLRVTTLETNVGKPDFREWEKVEINIPTPLQGVKDSCGKTLLCYAYSPLLEKDQLALIQDTLNACYKDPSRVWKTLSISPNPEANTFHKALLTLLDGNTVVAQATLIIRSGHLSFIKSFKEVTSKNPFYSLCEEWVVKHWVDNEGVYQGPYNFPAKVLTIRNPSVRKIRNIKISKLMVGDASCNDTPSLTEIYDCDIKELLLVKNRAPLNILGSQIEALYLFECPLKSTIFLRGFIHSKKPLGVSFPVSEKMEYWTKSEVMDALEEQLDLLDEHLNPMGIMNLTHDLPFVFQKATVEYYLTHGFSE